MRRFVVLLFLSLAFAAGIEPPVSAPELKLPLKGKSVRFAVIGDNGTGEKPEYDVAQQMAKYHTVFPFDFVIMLGDNIYGSKDAAAFKRKFEDPYAPLLSAGVKFYASLGNHDDPNERFYKPFNMGGQRYYRFKSGDVDFYALDSNYMDVEELNWLQRELPSGGGWKICFFHHPLYSNGRFHGPDADLRTRLEPLLQQNGIDVVFAGHDHVYERLKPQKGIYYFVLGNAGELRPHDLKPSSETIKGFDTDRAFMLVEITGDQLYFQTIARTGVTIDSGALPKAMHVARAGGSGVPQVRASFSTLFPCNGLCARYIGRRRYYAGSLPIVREGRLFPKSEAPRGAISPDRGPLWYRQPPHRSWTSSACL